MSKHRPRQIRLVQIERTKSSRHEVGRTKESYGSHLNYKAHAFAQFDVAAHILEDAHGWSECVSLRHIACNLDLILMKHIYTESQDCDAVNGLQLLRTKLI